MSDEVKAAAARALDCRYACINQQRDWHISACPAAHRHSVEAEMRSLLKDAMAEMVEAAKETADIGGESTGDMQMDQRYDAYGRAILNAMRQRARKWGVE